MSRRPTTKVRPVRCAAPAQCYCARGVTLQRYCAYEASLLPAGPAWSTAQGVKAADQRGAAARIGPYVAACASRCSCESLTFVQKISIRRCGHAPRGLSARLCCAVLRARLVAVPAWGRAPRTDAGLGRSVPRQVQCTRFTSFQLADGFPDPWPVFVARQFALASTTCGLTTLSSSSISSRCCRSRASGSCGPSWCDWRSVLSQGSLSCTCVWSVRAVRRRCRVVVGAMLETALVGRSGSGNLASWGFRTCPVRLAHPRNDPRKF